MGRPTDFTRELANEICETIATTPYGLRRLCAENPHWPDRVTIWKWTVKHEWFGNQYARAKEFQVDWLAEEAMEIADDGSRDTYKDDKGNDRCDHEWVQRSRLRVDTIKWYASKLKPKKFGERLQVSTTDDKAELEAAKEKATKLMAEIHG